MRDGWRAATLGSVATRRKDFTPVVADTRYRVVGVQRSGWGLVDREPVRGDSMKFDKLMELNADNLVYRTITAFEAPSAVVPSEFGGAFVTPQAFPTYAIDREQLLPAYMALLTTAPEFHEAMSSRCVGSVLRRKTLSQSAFESIPLLLPPVPEQRRVVDMIAAVDTAVDAAGAEVSATLRALSEALVREIGFGGDSALGTMFPFMLGGAWGSDPGTEEQAVWALGPSAFRGGAVTVDVELATERSLSASRAAARALQRGDIVLERSGGGPTQPVGRVIRMESDDEWVVPSDFMRLLRVDTAAVDPRFAFWALWASYQAGMAAPFQKRTTSIFNLSIPDYLAGVKVTIPDLVGQRRIAELGDDGWGAVTAARASADALRTLRTHLLTVLLSGEHEIPDPYDALLEEVA